MTLMSFGPFRSTIQEMLYDKNALEYFQIAWNGTESKIPYVESHSTKLGK